MQPGQAMNVARAQAARYNYLKYRQRKVEIAIERFMRKTQRLESRGLTDDPEYQRQNAELMRWLEMNETLIQDMFSASREFESATSAIRNLENENLKLISELSERIVELVNVETPGDYATRQTKARRLVTIRKQAELRGKRRARHELEIYHLDGLMDD